MIHVYIVAAGSGKPVGRTGNDDLDIYLSYEFSAREEGYKVYITSR